MSRSNVSYDEVKIIADALSARGERPTISRVKEDLGGRGSTVAISTYLKQWRGGDDLDEKSSMAQNSVPAHLEGPSLVKENLVTEKPVQVFEETIQPLILPPVVLKEESGPVVLSKSHETLSLPVQEAEVTATAEGPRHKHGDQERSHHGQDQQPQRERKHFDRNNRQRNNDRQQFRGDRDRNQRNNSNHATGGGYHSNSSPLNMASQSQGVSTDERGESSGEKTQPTFFNYWSQYDYVFHGDLSEKSDRELEIIIRRMEALLAKEQSRRETAEKLFEETQEYASALKKQIADRINDIKFAHDAVVTELKAQAREIKLAAEKDLMFYRDQLGRANQKIVELLKGTSDSQAPDSKETGHTES